MIITLLLVVLTCLITSIYYNRVIQRRENTIVSIREAIELTGFPILAFQNNGKTLKFLLDTGSNVNLIESSLIPELMITDKEVSKSNIHSINDKEGLSENYKICFNYEQVKFQAEFMGVSDVSGFNLIKEKTGIEINGILGSPFMTKYKYILDLDKLKIRINK